MNADTEKRLGAIERRLSTIEEFVGGPCTEESDTDTRTAPVDGVIVNTRAYTVTVDSARVDIGLSEFELLMYMARHKGTAFTPRQLLEAVWGGGSGLNIMTEYTVHAHVKNMREKLGEHASAVKTVRGVGYRVDKNAPVYVHDDIQGRGAPLLDRADHAVSDIGDMLGTGERVGAPFLRRLRTLIRDMRDAL